MGIPVVSTTAATGGLDARQGQNMLVADSPEELAAAIVRVLADPNLATRLGAAGRATALERYTWAAKARELQSVFMSVAAGRAQVLQHA